MAQAGKQALEKSLQSNIAAIMKGEETSLKDALLNIAKSVTDAMIDSLGRITMMGSFTEHESTSTASVQHSNRGTGEAG